MQLSAGTNTWFNVAVTGSVVVKHEILYLVFFSWTADCMAVLNLTVYHC